MRIQWILATRYLRGRLQRSILTTLAIAFGVAILYGMIRPSSNNEEGLIDIVDNCRSGLHLCQINVLHLYIILSAYDTRMRWHRTLNRRVIPHFCKSRSTFIIRIEFMKLVQWVITSIFWGKHNFIQRTIIQFIPDRFVFLISLMVHCSNPCFTNWMPTLN